MPTFDLDSLLNSGHAVIDRPRKIEDESVIPADYFDRYRRPIALGYVRVSKERQALSPEAQKKVIWSCYETYLAETHDWKPAPGEFFVDQGKSARKYKFRERPAGAKVDELLAEGDAIILAKLDRGFRSLFDQTSTFADWMERGIVIYSASEGLTSATDAGRLVLNVLGSFAQFESERIGARLSEAVAVARERGSSYCVAPLGFDWAGPRKQRHLTRNSSERYVMGKIVEWKRAGHTWDEIALHLDKKRTTTVKNCINGRTLRKWGRHRAHNGYYQELFIRWLEANGANFRDPRVMRLLVGGDHKHMGGPLSDLEFRRQLEMEVTW